MKSNVCNITGNGCGIETALKEAEKTAVYEELNHKEAMQLRLLAEELTGIMRAVTTDFKAKFWIEAQNKQIKLCLESDITLSREEKKQLVSVSKTSGRKPVKTFMGKIGRILETILDNYEETGKYSIESGIMLPYSEGMAASSLAGNEIISWSWDHYKTAASSNVSEEWDELEKSIVASLADDVIVSVKDQKAEIAVYKQF